MPQFQTKSIPSLAILTISLALLTGCTSTTTSTTNTVTNSNTSNSNVVVDSNANVNATTNENTNTDTAAETEIDTSDWLTYTNEDMGVQFDYPSEWTLDEYYSDYAWEKKYDEASAWVRFTESNGEKLMISRGRSETIEEEVSEPTEIKYTNVTYTDIYGYNAAEVESVNTFVSDATLIETWVEINGDLIRMPDIEEFPELKAVIATFQITED